IFHQFIFSFSVTLLISKCFRMKHWTAVVVLMFINLTQQYRTDVPVKLIVQSRRNVSGHWIAQVQLEHEDNGHPIQVDLDHSLARNKETNTVQIRATITGPPGPPGEGYELVPGFGYYKYYGVAKTWQEAVETCQAEGGHLLIVNSDAEFAVVKKIWDRNPSIYKDWRKNHLYIGLTDKAKEGNWVSILGKLVTYCYPRIDKKKTNSTYRIFNIRMHKKL
ncbi:hypothetical protein L9F63_006091, partial [Diploptera punctata]